MSVFKPGDHVEFQKPQHLPGFFGRWYPGTVVENKHRRADGSFLCVKEKKSNWAGGFFWYPPTGLVRIPSEEKIIVPALPPAESAPADPK